MRKINTMPKQFLIKTLIVLCCFIVVQVSHSASLNNRNNKSKANRVNMFSFSSQNGYVFKGGAFLAHVGNTGLLHENSTIQFEKGNILYIIPYKR